MEWNYGGGGGGGGGGVGEGSLPYGKRYEQYVIHVIRLLIQF